MRSYKKSCCLIHGPKVQSTSKVPAVIAGVDGFDRAYVNKVAIVFPNRVVSGIEVWLSPGDFFDDDVIWQNRVEAFPQGLRRMATGVLHTDHLTKGMHPTIGASCGACAHLVTGHLVEGLFEGLLYADLVGLGLPAAIVSTLVGDLQDHIARRYRLFLIGGGQE